MKARINNSPKVRLKSTGGVLDEQVLQEIKDRVTEEISEKYDEMYRNIADEICAQTLAYVFYTLEIEYGWRRQRLQGFETALLETLELAKNPPSVLLKNLDSDVIETHLSEAYGVDIRSKFKPVYQE